MRFIFDLDGTVIDSSHRQGDTLADWRRMNTVGNIMRDRLLPSISFVALSKQVTWNLRVPRKRSHWISGHICFGYGQFS